LPKMIKLSMGTVVEVKAELAGGYRYLPKIIKSWSVYDWSAPL
jgi:hypothetical protein